MKIGRVSGILLHVTSLPGKFGIGDLGPESHGFVDCLVEARQKLWCVLPLGPTGRSNSPYECRSAFAGNPLVISPELLVEHGYLSRRELNPVPRFSPSLIDFPEVRIYKQDLLGKAFRNFHEDRDYLQFEDKHGWWLEDYALFMGLNDANHGVCWTKFKHTAKPARQRIGYHKFVQYEFFRQWKALRRYCGERGVSIMGDLPFYVEHDSADVWSNQRLFDLQKDGEPRWVGGVPPDYFSKNGQLWGNPTYRWDRIAETRFAWWINRLRSTLEMVDVLRLDHFRGFESFWRVDAGQSTARRGRWIKGPGKKLFDQVRNELGELPFVAENLGIITPEVEQLRRSCGFPGMGVLQFGFDEAGTHRPNNYVREQVSFTGTHDNDTTLGWWRSLQKSARDRGRSPQREILQRAKSYLQTNGEQIHWSFIQAVLTSVADVAIIPLQDVLGLGSEARMNKPGRARGNWRWRFEKKQEQQRILDRLRDLTAVSGR